MFIKRYGLIGSWKLLVSFIYTKIVFPRARLIRLPFDIRNSGHIDIGNNLTTGFGCRVEVHSTKLKGGEICLRFKNNVQINDYVHIAAGEMVEIGNDVLIASKVFISDINHGSYSGEIHDNPNLPPNERILSTNPVFIEDNVWIGEGVCVMSGVKIGKGSIIGASSVVTKDIPSHSIAVGSPAKVIKTFNFSNNKWEII